MLDFLQPSLNVRKRFTIGHIVHDYDAVRATIISVILISIYQNANDTFTTILPSDFGTYVLVMVRKRSWPAVSQICNLMRCPFFAVMVRILKSTPIVVM